MAGFRTHITTSTVLGAGYGAYGFAALGMPMSPCIVAAGLCSVSGMLPDLDSDTGVPLRECVCFGSAVIPMLMLDRFEHMGMSHEDMVLGAGLIYVFIRFVVAEIFRRYTVHRGMWHSIPAAAICGLIAYLICSCEPSLRLFKSGAVVLGFMSHLVLDEIYSFEVGKRGKVRIKKSFGTAVKLWSKKPWANISTYGKLSFLLTLVFVGEQKFVEYFEQQEHKLHYTANRVNRALNHVLGEEGIGGMVNHRHDSSGGGHSLTAQPEGAADQPRAPFTFGAGNEPPAPLFRAPQPSTTVVTPYSATPPRPAQR